MSRRWWEWMIVIWLGGGMTTLLAGYIGCNTMARLALAATIIAYIYHLAFNHGWEDEEDEDGDEPIDHPGAG
ncbi:MAG: hypothetical protein ABFE07_28890 [Armatimonadia bacterium]